MTPKIQIPQTELAEFCQRHHIRKLSLFGSVLRDDFRHDSDIDVLVEFEAGTRVGFRIGKIQRELSELLRREVHISTPGSIHASLLPRIQNLAEVEYERA